MKDLEKIIKEVCKREGVNTEFVFDIESEVDKIIAAYALAQVKKGWKDFLEDLLSPAGEGECKILKYTRQEIKELWDWCESQLKGEESNYSVV